MAKYQKLCTRCIWLCLLILTVTSFMPSLASAQNAESAFEAMQKNCAHFTTKPGEVVVLNMIQENADGEVLRENNLVMVVKNVEDTRYTAIHVREDDTMFFSEQKITPDDPLNDSRLYLPPIPGMKNSGKVYRINQNTMRQSFIGSDFFVIDLEQVNIYSEPHYSSAPGEGIRVLAESERYGKREITLDSDFNLQEVLYFTGDELIKRSIWRDYKDNRAQNIVMQRLKGGQMYRQTKIAAQYYSRADIPMEAFDHKNTKKAQRVITDLVADNVVKQAM